MRPHTDEQKMMVCDLVRRVSELMRDGRYPPLHNQKVELNVPFRIRYPRS
ncbi:MULTISPECIES: hypothetical protein [unclassified Methanoregula]|nr:MULTISPECIES: hypothetical protein [unclassified Methanoregula]OPX65381.1 MAG: hypothetical protein A4E33_00414 [Methanoregula sp. PtaB.Bin085]OPY32290.1 MAG: hypothetical protein A4E34_02664 [Methanoregula sp. PtaU1.Bin006]